MADYEKPVNEYDFKNGERPEIERKEEEFMYRYLESRDKKKPKSDDVEEAGGMNEDGDSDPELEAFADEAIRKEMQRLQSGHGPIGDDENSADEDVSYTESENEENQSSQSDDSEHGESDDNEALAGQFKDSSDEDGNDGKSDEEEEDFFSDQEEL